MTPVFNMPPSILQSQWVMPDVRDDDIAQIIRDHGVPEIVARLLASGIANKLTAPPADKIDLPDYSAFVR